MNKLIILAIVVIILTVVSLGLIDEDQEVHQLNSKQDIELDIIKPPMVGIADDVESKKQDKLDLNSKISVAKKEVYARGSKGNIKSMRNELVKLHQSENVSYETLGAVLEKYKGIKYNEKSTKSSLERIQYNLSLARKISNLTQKLHHEVNGKKEMDPKVLAEIMALQKQLLVRDISTSQVAQ